MVVAQWGYRAVPDVDAAWLSLQMSNVTARVAAPGNVRGAVAFGTGEARVLRSLALRREQLLGGACQVPNNGSTPYCSAAECSLAFSVELFVNLGDNPRLDGMDFSSFGLVAVCGIGGGRDCRSL